MKLIEIVIKNFRGYKGEYRIPAGDLTAFIGKNDAGKSTVLDALAAFFDHPLGKIDFSDVCVFDSDPDEVVIGCVFSDFPSILTIDAASETSLDAEFLLNCDGNLEIHKVFAISNGKLIKAKVYARAHHPSNTDVADLLLKKNSDLKKLAKEKSIEDAVDLRSNVALRKALWSSVDDLRLEDVLIQLDKEGAKAIWEQLTKYLPEFALFRADRPSTDEDSEVQDPLKVAIQQAVREVEDELEAIKKKVKERALGVTARTVIKLADFDKSLASQLDPGFRADPNWGGLFKITLAGDNGIPINKRGSGVRRLVLFSFFRAEAERLQEEHGKSNIIYAIEEPEAAQHPDNQRKIIESLVSLSQNDGCQVLLTTHVPGLASLLPTESIRFIQVDDTGTRTIKAGTEDTYEIVADELGVVPDKRAQVLLCVEGPHDVQFLRRVNAIMRKENPELLDLNNDHRIAWVVLGGGNLQSWVNHRYLENLRLPEVHIYDRDLLEKGKYKYQADVDKVNDRDDDSTAYLTKKRELENYLDGDAVIAAFASTDHAITKFDISDDSDVEKDLEAKLGKRKVNRRSLKHWLNEDAIDQMTVERLKARNALTEISEWFDAITLRLKET